MADAVLLQGDCTDTMKECLPDNSVDSMVTDPPAGIAFMGKEWDGDKGGRDQWTEWLTGVMREALRTMKPGAHGLVWAIPRTSHWTARALEDAGFEIRDVVTHLFGTGFPKSMDVSKAIDKAAGVEREVVGKGVAGKSSIGQETRVEQGARPTVRDGSDFDITAPATKAAKQWEGWGTALKPASEHWILVRKPCSEKTVAANVLKWGTGAINIDGCRVESEPWTRSTPYKDNIKGGALHAGKDKATYECPPQAGNQSGRFPANLVLDEDGAAALDAQSGIRTSGKAPGGLKRNADKARNSYSEFAGQTAADPTYGDTGGASRFFYTAKASKSDKGETNTHPTVKSTTLMAYLCRLVTPPGGLVLDPFAGSGSTGVAALKEGFNFLGIEQSAEYCAIAQARLDAVSSTAQQESTS